MDTDKIILSLKQEENAGLGRIFRELRKLSRLELIGDIILYKNIINTLSFNGYEIVERSITRHFENIDPDDYDLADKREIIRDLKEGASINFGKRSLKVGREVINDTKIVHTGRIYSYPHSATSLKNHN